MIWLILGIVGWLFCGAANYRLIRWATARDDATWTLGDRRFALSYSCLGPFALFCVLMGEWMISLQDENKPAKW